MTTWGAGKIIRYFGTNFFTGAYVTVSSDNGYTLTFTNDGGTSQNGFIRYYYDSVDYSMRPGAYDIVSFTGAGKNIPYIIVYISSGGTYYYPYAKIVVVDPPTDSAGFIFVSTAPFNGDQKIVLLPDPAQCSGKMLFIKDRSWNAGATATPNLGNYNILVIPPDGVLIDGATAKSISDNGGCLILVCDGSTYYIANYCKPATQFLYGVTYSSNIHNAQANKICVFAADGANNGAVNLPSAAGNSGAICIIRLSSSATTTLYINTAIDNSTSTSPYVSSPFADTGRNYISVIFICDGATWYSAGVHSGANISRTATTSSNTIGLSINTFAKATNGPYALPFISMSTSIAGLSIMKSTADNTVDYCNTANSTIIAGSTNFPNGSVRISANAACIWFYTQSSASSTVYNVILSYIP